MKKIIDVVGAIIIHDDMVLCAQRNKKKSLGGLWEFPGGKIEAGESPRQALMRELEEELRIQVDVDPEPFNQARYAYDFGTVQLTCFICRNLKGNLTLVEHEDVKWLRVEELDRLEWAPVDIPAVQLLMEEGY